MDRWLVTNLSSFALAAVVISALVLPAVFGVWLLRRQGTPVANRISNDVTGIVLTVMAAIYGVMLAFVVVVLYEDFRDAQSDVHIESGALSNLYRSSQQLPAPIAGAMKVVIRDYVEVVTGPERKSLTKGEGDPQGWADVASMYDRLGDFIPADAQQEAFFDHALDALAGVVDARRARIDAASASLPPPFVLLVVFGGYLLLMFTLFFDVANRRYHLLVVVSVAMLIGSSITLALALEFPFSGDVSVSLVPFYEGGLAEFAPG